MYLLLSIIMLSCAQFGSQLFFPALPEIAQHFSLKNEDAQQIMMLYFIGFGLSQLLFGPWSDIAGRRKIFLVGQSIFIIGTTISLFANSATLLAIGRILQGLGAGAPLIVSRALLSDTMKNEQLKKAIASLAVAASFVSVLSPLIGGWITTNTSWKGLFLSVVIYLLITWIVGFKLLPQQAKINKVLSGKVMLKDYAMLMSDARYLSAAAFKWLPTLVFLSCATYFPFELQYAFSLSAEQYGAYISITSCGLIGGTLLAKFALRFIPYKSIIILFWPLHLLAGLGFYFLPFTLFNSLLCYGLFLICAGAYYPCSLQLTIEPFRSKVGTVSALTGAVDMFIFSSLAALINRYWITDIKSMAVLLISTASILMVSWFVIHTQDKKHNLMANNHQQNQKLI